MSTSTGTRSGSYHHGDLAASLEQAALEVISEKGTAAVSLREVARRAGVSHNAPYHHFGDRQGLLRAVAARGLGDMLDAMRGAAEATSDPREQLHAVGQAYVDFAIDHPGQFSIIFDPEVCNPADPNPVTGPLVEANEEFLIGAVRTVLPGVEEPEVQATAAAAWALVHGMANLVSAGHLPREVVPHALASTLGPGATRPS